MPFLTKHEAHDIIVKKGNAVMDEMIKTTDKHLRITHRNDYVYADRLPRFPHSHEFLELYIHISGKAEYMVENGVWPIEYGSVVVTRENELHCIRMAEDCVFQNVYLELGREVFENFAPELLACFDERPIGQKCVFTLPRDIADRCVMKLLEARAASLTATPLGFYEGCGVVMSVLAEVNRVWEAWYGFIKDPDESYKQNSTLCRKAVALFYKHCADIRKVGDFANQLYVSREHLSRCFSSELGISVREFMVQSRVRLSTLYLKQGAGLEEVCAKCGWNDYSYFINVFRREVGITPAKYREKYFGKR